MRLILVLFAALACTAAFAGDVYKWKDSDGHVHYGDKPKTGGESVEIRGQASSDDVAAASGDPATAAECQRRKAKLESYRKAPSISETDNLGKTRQYTDEERQQFMAIYEKQTAEVCAPAAPAQ